jgi:hypothetical protein
MSTPMPKKIIAFLIVACAALSAFSEDDTSKFYGKWSWTVLGGTKVEYRVFGKDGSFQKLVVVENPIDKTRSELVDPAVIKFNVLSEVKLMSLRAGTAIYVYQYEFLAKDKVLLTDVTLNENPQRILCVRQQN